MTKVAKSAVRFDVSEYVNNHGAAPRGDGGWAFCDAAEARSVDLPASLKFFYGHFGWAKKQAAAWFADLGVSRVAVLS